MDVSERPFVTNIRSCLSLKITIRTKIYQYKNVKIVINGHMIGMCSTLVLAPDGVCSVCGTFRLSGSSERPAYPGFIVIKTAQDGFSLNSVPSNISISA